MKTALFTVSFAGLWGQDRLTLEESIDKVAELGFQGIEIMGKRPHLSPLDRSVEDCERILAQAKKRGLTVAAVAGYTDFTGGAEAGEVPFVDMQVAYVEELARRASALECDLVRIFTAYERDDLPFARQWQTVITALRECCDRARDLGVSIGVQNHHDLGVSPKTLEELLVQVDRPNLVPMVDCWSLFLRGEDVSAVARAFGPRMRFTTVADYVVLPRARYRPELVNYAEQKPPFVMAVPMGDGELPYAEFLSALREVGFDGWVSYEMCSPLRGGGAMGNLERCAKAFLAYFERNGLGS
jgi:sugar phosphate isomerase/epimerase